jgi:tetratricopeptide (TPR) repeat protein
MPAARLQASALLMRRKSMVLWGGLLAALLCIVLGHLIVQQIRVWHNSDTLWAHVARSFPGKVPMAHNNLGMAYEKRGMYDQAVAACQKAISINPRFVQAYNNLGMAYYAAGNYPMATMSLEKASSLCYQVDPRLLESAKPNR